MRGPTFTFDITGKEEWQFSKNGQTFTMAAAGEANYRNYCWAYAYCKFQVDRGVVSHTSSFPILSNTTLVSDNNVSAFA